MTADEIHAIAQTFVNNSVDKIRLNGGELLLRKDFPEITAKLGSLQTEISSLWMLPLCFS
ncbi:hypothetical protein ACNQF7_03850 [Flavobacterium sp. RSP29]|uniref:hypothetical protein n=1 Tax=Flavobacterium sp. RSP29 TaxID=3401731 RepID=UPI003AAB7A6C